MRPSLRLFARSIALALLALGVPAAAQEALEHSWAPLGEEVRERLDAPILRGPFRPARLGDEPVVLCALGEGADLPPEPLPGAPFRLKVQSVAFDGLRDVPGLEDLRLPSGPFPALHRALGATLCASSAHLLWVDPTRVRVLDAPWGRASRAPQLLGDEQLVIALAPDGTLWMLHPELAPRALLPRGASRALHAAYAGAGRLLWIDELGWMNELALTDDASPELREVRALEIEPARVRGFVAAGRDAFLALEGGGLLWLRDGAVVGGASAPAWPEVDPVALEARAEGELELADRCGWISRARAEAAPAPRVAWSDGFVRGWTRTLRAVAFPGGWLLQREEALIAVRGGRAVELRSGALPFGLSRPGASARHLPWNALPEWILPRTIRGVSDGSAGLWILTSSSIDLFAPDTERILSRTTLGSSARSRAWEDEPLTGFAGGLVFESTDGGGTEYFLRAPADRELVHLRVSANGSSELQLFEPGPSFPPPPYGGVALDRAGDLLIASRRGLWWKRREAPSFERVRAEGLDALARCADAVPAPDGGFVVLAGGRALGWSGALSRFERWAPELELRALGRAADGSVSASDGHRLYDLSPAGARAWPCPPTPRDAEVRAFARAASERGPFYVLDRENRVWRSEGSRWHALEVREPLSDASGFTATRDGGLYLHLDASLWRLDEPAGPRRALEYRVALARWIDQRGLRNLNFAFGALLLAVLVFAALGGFLLPKGPIPIARAPLQPWRLADAALVLALFLGGQLAIDLALRALDLEGYPVLRAALRFSVPGLAAVAAMLLLLRRRYERGLESIGVPHVPTAVAVQQLLVGALMVVPVAIIAAGLAGWLGRVGAPPELLVQELRPLIPIGDLERFGVFLCMAVIAPLVEELLFRGFVQEVCVQRFGAPLGILATAALFAALHPAGGYAPLLVLALALGCARQATGSLHVCIGLHLAQNFVPALATAVGS
jgi:membrane protease YdiL (CAAX protease family)